MSAKQYGWFWDCFGGPKSTRIGPESMLKSYEKSKWFQIDFLVLQGAPRGAKMLILHCKNQYILEVSLSEKVDSRVRTVMLLELQRAPKSSSGASNFGSEIWLNSRVVKKSVLGRWLNLTPPRARNRLPGMTLSKKLVTKQLQNK